MSDTPSTLPPNALAEVGRRLVFVRDLEIVVSVGVLEHEKRYEQRILISADLIVRDGYDGRSDRLEQVLDYGKLIDGITLLVQSGHFNLIETLAERVAAHCLGDTRVESVRVRVEKPDIMPSCRSVGVEVERRRTS
ncbi:MAG TPA: dihydroneopterin aldolase [Burkholderiales bacterium]|jgi:7,8-dihydroneopterin aldolase/epimerase/oxygenase|nr:dihydroneopterin aldolase [Burkholderiales bacterium]